MAGGKLYNPEDYISCDGEMAEWNLNDKHQGFSASSIYFCNIVVLKKIQQGITHKMKAWHVNDVKQLDLQSALEEWKTLYPEELLSCEIYRRIGIANGKGESQLSIRSQELNGNIHNKLREVCKLLNLECMVEDIYIGGAGLLVCPEKHYDFVVASDNLSRLEKLDRSDDLVKSEQKDELDSNWQSKVKSSKESKKIATR